MKKNILTLLVCLMATSAFAGNLLTEGFEYANHDFQVPVGWNCNDNSWLCGYLEKDHNRLPHSGNWYAFSDAEAQATAPYESLYHGYTLHLFAGGELQDAWARPVRLLELPIHVAAPAGTN